MTLRGEDDIEDKDRRAMRLWKKPPPSSIRQYRTFLLCNLLTILSHGANPLLSRIQTTTAYQFKFRRRQHLGNAPLIMPTASVFGKNQSTPSSALSSATSDDELSVERPSSSKVDIARKISPTVWIQQLKVGYERRVAADPRFGSKSITEVILAATTQLMAEWNRRGADRLLPEFDFVFPAILAAVFGKYYRCVLYRGVIKMLEDQQNIPADRVYVCVCVCVCIQTCVRACDDEVLVPATQSYVKFLTTPISYCGSVKAETLWKMNCLRVLLCLPLGNYITTFSLES
jgi:hypothetical protein